MGRRSTTNGKLTLEHIPLEDIRCAYVRIEEGLHEITKKTYADWIPADVYASLKAGNSDVHIGYIKDEYAGFMVTSFTTDSGGEPVLFIWTGYQKPGYCFMEEAFGIMDKIAEEFNTTAIEFSSSRNGWKTIAKNLGYEMVTQLYRKEV